MTPEVAAKEAALRSRLRGAQSLHIYEAAQEAIKEARVLLDDVACQTVRPEDKPE